MDPLLPEDFLCSLPESGYAGILARARAISQRHLDRLHALRERFPDALPQRLLDWLADSSRDAPPDRRRAPRFAGCLCRVFVSSGETARVRDRSAGGLGLLLGRAVEVGTILRLGTDGPEEVWVAAEVRHCRSQPEGCLLGCRLLAAGAG